MHDGFYFSFNPVAPTALMKLAQTVTKTECGSCKGRTNRFVLPDKSVIEALVAGCSGDVRSLLNSLQFACLKGSTCLFHLYMVKGKSNNFTYFFAFVNLVLYIVQISPTTMALDLVVSIRVNQRAKKVQTMGVWLHLQSVAVEMLQFSCSNHWEKYCTVKVSVDIQ